MKTESHIWAGIIVVLLIGIIVAVATSDDSAERSVKFHLNAPGHDAWVAPAHVVRVWGDSRGAVLWFTDGNQLRVKENVQEAAERLRWDTR